MKRSRSSLLVLSLLVAGTTVQAQETPSSRGAVRPFVGAYIPTGDQRDFLKDAVLLGAQASWNATPNIAVTGSFGWSPSKDRIAAGDQEIDLFQYDVGLEARSSAVRVGLLSPFIGAGVGGRTYNYRDLDVESKSNFDGYGALGFDAALGLVSLRVEGRDYISRFQPLIGGGETKTRNDVALFAAVGVNF
jgi:hypothetical protein